MVNVAIIIGHHAKSQGASMLETGQTEYRFNTELMFEITGVLQERVCYDVYLHDTINDYYKRIKDTVKRMGAQKYHLVLELHFNAAADEAAHGAEALYLEHNPRTKYFAELFSLNCATAFQLHNRGAKPRNNPKQRGYWMLQRPPWDTVILEPFFGSNANDVSKVAHQQKRLAHVIHRTVCQFIDFNYYFNAV